MLFSDHIDWIRASGVLMEDIWNGKRIITIDQLGGFNETAKALTPLKGVLKRILAYLHVYRG